MRRGLRIASLSVAFLVAACIDNGGPPSPATSSVNLESPAAAVPLPSDALLATSAVTIVPPVSSTVTNLANGALVVVGDTLGLVGDQTAALGTIPAGAGSIVMLASDVPVFVGESLPKADGLDSVLYNILSTSLNPLESSAGLLAPAATNSGSVPALLGDSTLLVSASLQQALATELALGSAHGTGDRLVAVTPLLTNGAPTSFLAPSVASINPTISTSFSGVAPSGMIAGMAASTGAAAQVSNGTGALVTRTSNTLSGTVTGLLGKH